MRYVQICGPTLTCRQTSAYAQDWLDYNFNDVFTESPLTSFQNTRVRQIRTETTYYPAVISQHLSKNISRMRAGIVFSISRVCHACGGGKQNIKPPKDPPITAFSFILLY